VADALELGAHARVRGLELALQRAARDVEIGRDPIDRDGLTAFDPIAANAPYISHAFEIFDQMIEEASEGGRLHPGQIIIMGFSQGACLAVEYTVRNLGRSRNIVALTGGLFGSPGALWPAYPRPLSRTRILLTGSDADDWVPEERVRDTAQLLTGLGAEVTLRIYTGRPHIMSDPELEEARIFLQ